MKSFIIVLLLISFNIKAVSQSQKIKDSLIEVSIPYTPASLQISQDTLGIAFIEVSDNDEIAFKKLNPGSYTVILLRGTQKVEILKKVFISDTFSLVFKTKNIGPCLYDHPVGYVQKCPFGDDDKIIPVIYGLPTPELLKDAENGKIKFAGCTTPCGPKFYCTKHQVMF